MKTRAWVLLAAVVLASAGPSSAAAAPDSAKPESADAVVRAYLNAPRWEDRLQYVLRAAEVKPLMEARYGHGWKAPEYKIDLVSELPSSSDDWAVLAVEIGDRVNIYYLRKTPQGFKIDWENSVGFNPTSPEEIRATKPVWPVRFRALAQLDDYENSRFKYPEDATLSIRLTDADGKSIGQAYLDKKSPDGFRLFDVLKDGRRHAVAVDLRYIPYPQEGNTFLISKVVQSESWFYEPEK
jgi:hypothetical protein